MPRGRPKKSPVQVSADEVGDANDTSATADASPTPKRRGRPPKNQAQAKPEDTDNESVRNAPPNGTEPRTVRRGRGRPPKNTVQPKNGETDPETAQDTTPVVRRGRGRPKKVDTTGSASVTTASPARVVATKTGRPRGWPPKPSRAASFATPTTQASTIPTGRGRGRLPKNADTSSAADSPVTQEPETPFALENLVGSYTVRSPEIDADIIPELVNEDDNEDQTLCGTLEISQDMLDDDMLYGKLKFGDISGSMALTLSVAQLKEWARDDQSGEEEERVTSDIVGNNDETTVDQDINGKGKAKSQDDDDDDAEDDQDNSRGNIEHELEEATAGMKRKEAPVQRDRGRPPKRKNLPPAPRERIIVYFVYSHEMSNERHIEQDRRFGTIEPDDNECKSVHGVFPHFPVIDKLAVFHAKKIDTVAEPSEVSEED